MRFTPELAAVHGYLCGDGYVCKHKPFQKHKYYHIGFRNTNQFLLKDFQKKFQICFGLIPYIVEGRCRIQNKQIYSQLTKEYSYYSYEWKLPQLNMRNAGCWLRAFFDCEGWVENRPGKSRLIGLECCNKQGLYQVQSQLLRFGISTTVKKKTSRRIWRLTICGRKKLELFQQNIGFLHPEKKKKLQEALYSYQNFTWDVPTSYKELLIFIEKQGRVRESRREIRLFSVKKENLLRLAKALNSFQLPTKLFGPWKSSTGSKYYCLTISMDVLYGKTTIGSSASNKADQ